MNIDYEKISLAAREEASNLLVSVRQVKKIIEAYEAQKKAPEWVPLDLATVKQGQEVRYAHWSSDVPPVLFVGTYGRSFVTDNGLGGLSIRGRLDWLMRAPKPKTVRVSVWKCPDRELCAYVGDYGPANDACLMIGEGDIEVQG